jgi:hypothetical protein
VPTRASDPFARDTRAPGTVLQAEEGPDTFPLAAIGTLDPRNAMAEVLAAFLRCAVFMRDGGTMPDKRFALERVLPEWPDPKKEIQYPSASVIDSADVPYEAHNLVPSALEETWESFGKCTMLWKTGEAVATFQVDYWATDTPTREAIAARLPSLFSPTEARVGVMLAGDPRYFRRPVRATLLDHRRVDTQERVFSRDRRLQTMVRCEIDVVHLRKAVELDPEVRLDVTQEPWVADPVPVPTPPASLVENGLVLDGDQIELDDNPIVVP